MTENEISVDESEKAWDYGLKKPHRLFVLYYCTDVDCWLNATRAYQKAYKKTDKKTGKIVELDANTCAVNGHKLLRKTNVSESVQKLLRLTQDELDATNVYKLLKALEILSTYDPAKIIDAEGLPIVNSLEELGPLSICVQAIERKSDPNGNIYISKVVLADRQKAIGALSKYLEIVRPEVTSGIESPIILVNPVSADGYSNFLSSTYGAKALPVPENTDVT